MATQESLKKIKSGILSRGLALARVSVSAGARAATHAVGNLFSSESERPERLKEMLTTQVAALAKELGELKGSLMKVGQMLSMYGEHFFPPEVNDLLKSLQSQSPPLDFSVIQKTLHQQLSPEILSGIQVDPVAVASASLGQVHRVIRKSDGRVFAMKIQYPGVDRAIDGDLKALQSILSLSKLIPKGPKYDDLFKEVRLMLHREVDYSKELKTTQEFREIIASDPRYVVPEVIPELSTKRILTTSFEEGVAVDGPEVRALSQERRSALGAALLELYFKEIFELGCVQTDPHFGNYRVKLNESGQSDQLVLLDFGAVRKFPKTFLDPYHEMIRGAALQDPSRIIKGAMGVGFLLQEDSQEVQEQFAELCCLFAEPFLSPSTPGVRTDLFDLEGNYLWDKSDLPNRLAKKGAQVAYTLKFRSPPGEIIFLDRKMGGIFIFLSVLGVRISSKKLIEKYL